MESAETARWGTHPACAASTVQECGESSDKDRLSYHNSCVHQHPLFVELVVEIFYCVIGQCCELKVSTIRRNPLHGRQNIPQVKCVSHEAETQLTAIIIIKVIPVTMPKGNITTQVHPVSSG